MIMLTLTVTPVTTKATGFTESDVIDTITASSEKFVLTDLSMSEQGDYLLYKLTATESAVYKIYGESEEWCSTTGFILDDKLDTLECLESNNNGGSNGNFYILRHIAEGETIYLAIKYTSETYVGTVFDLVVEKSDKHAMKDGLIFVFWRDYGFDTDGDGSVDTFDDSYGLYKMQLPYNHEKIVVPEEVDGVEVRYIGEKAFYLNDKLKTVVLPDTIVKIERWAFWGCTSLENVNLPKGLNTIGKEAFSQTIIKEINIPATTTYIAYDFAQGNTELVAINIAPENINYKSVDGVFYSKNGKYLFCYPRKKKDKEYTVLDETEIIYDYAFSWSKLEIVNLPSSLKSIHQYAFSSCSKLREIQFNEGLETIEKNAFYGCKLLARVDYPASIISIGDYAFDSCQLLSVVIFRDKGNLEKIGHNCYFDTRAKYYGYNNSYAKQYCDSNDYTFVDIDTIDCEQQHAFEEDIITKIPTCLERGLSSTKCVKCGIEGEPFELYEYQHSYQTGICTMCFTPQYVSYEIEPGKIIKVKCTYEGGATFIYAAKQKEEISLSVDSMSKALYYRYKIKKTNGETSSTNEIESKPFTKSINLEAGDTIAIYITPYHYEIGDPHTNFSFNFMMKTSTEEKTTVNQPTTTTNSQKCSHKYIAKVTKAPTSKIAGVMTYRCSSCGSSYTKTIDKIVKPTLKLIAIKKGFKVSWKKQPKASGYQIRYSTSKKMKKAKTKTYVKNTITSAKIKELKTKNQYYVQIRAYNVIGGKRYVGSWSKAKKINIK